MKKIAFIVSGLVLMLVLAACSGRVSSKDDLTPTNNSSSIEQATDNDKQDNQSQGKTEEAESDTQIYDDSGMEAYNAGGIRIVVKSLEEEMMDWDLLGQNLTIYIENNTDQNISVDLGYAAVNGFEGDPLGAPLGAPLGPNDNPGKPVLAGRKALVGYFFLNPNPSESIGIEQIENLELSFHIYNSDTGDEIVDTGIASLTF